MLPHLFELKKINSSLNVSEVNVITSEWVRRNKERRIREKIV